MNQKHAEQTFCLIHKQMTLLNQFFLVTQKQTAQIHFKWIKNAQHNYKWLLRAIFIIIILLCHNLAFFQFIS